MNKYLDIAPEVAEALAAGKPVVALESTIISHGMPYPQNVETALKVEQIIRDAGAVPATIAIIGGRLKAGLSKEEIDYLGRTGAGIPKASRRDLPVLVAQGKDGACTVTTTMMIADMAGIRVFATGGIGGVHRGAQETFDISADLEELANTSVMVVCAVRLMMLLWIMLCRRLKGSFLRCICILRILAGSMRRLFWNGIVMSLPCSTMIARALGLSRWQGF